MKTIAIIPVRGGSKRLQNKNILPLGGIPLMAHSILFAQDNSSIINEIYVSTDDEHIKSCALQYGVKVIDRPQNLSGDFEPTVTVLKHVLQTIDDEVENVILLQATNPLRPKNILTEAFEVYEENNSDSLFTVTRNYQKFGKIVNNKFIPFNYIIGQRSQDLDPLYFENGLLYITKAKLILKEIIISENAIPFEVNHMYANVDIDNQQDLDYAEYAIRQ
ncbi:MAG: acylneuraminate cytidylyltransferase family protein [Flavobacterium sp.]